MSIDPNILEKIKGDLLNMRLLSLEPLHTYLQKSDNAKTVIQVAEVVCKVQNKTMCILTLKDIQDTTLLPASSIDSVLKVLSSKDVIARQYKGSRNISYMFDYSENGSAKEALRIIQQTEKVA